MAPQPAETQPAADEDNAPVRRRRRQPRPPPRAGRCPRPTAPRRRARRDPGTTTAIGRTSAMFDPTTVLALQASRRTPTSPARSRGRQPGPSSRRPHRRSRRQRAAGIVRPAAAHRGRRRRSQRRIRDRRPLCGRPRRRRATWRRPCAGLSAQPTRASRRRSSASRAFTRRATASRKTSSRRAGFTSPPPKRATPRPCTTSPCSMPKASTASPTTGSRPSGSAGRPRTAWRTASSISAILYARGIGIEQNLAESYKWFALAANTGDQDAARKRDEVAGRGSISRP